MPQSIPKGLTREHVLAAIADLDAGIEHPFGEPTGYELVHDDKRYPPKAVVGIAFRHLSGQIIPPGDFSGGEAPGQAYYVLHGHCGDGVNWSRYSIGRRLEYQRMM